MISNTWTLLNRARAAASAGKPNDKGTLMSYRQAPRPHEQNRMASRSAGRCSRRRILMNLIQKLEKEHIEKLSAGKTIPDFQPGDTVLVNYKVVEGERSRIQAY